ncbi:hypothetical protein ABT390_16710 [Streptomyces aurantiacus]|uniref:Lipoprotein n=1 Tax=Streptomyces aurantiacus JA 4570 TaxID=1286094 RepID=S4ATJ5_9ACTN|nr:hypothetical protein [Streptomyces aurantiacus]EPH44747.1 hypothetical protein STRAU_2187 [Streptomyces aurantiacus JA 4570]
MRLRTAGAVCGAAALALLVPACSDDDGGKGDKGGKKDGTADQSAREISDRAKQELLDAKSVHLTLSDKSRDVEKDDPAAMDLALDRDGNCAGTLRFGGTGGSAELIKRGDKVWMKPDDKFWKNQVPGGQGAAAAELFKGRYIHGSTNDDMLKGLAEVCDLKELQKSVSDDSDGDDAKDLKKGKVTTVDGTRVVPLTGKDDDGNDTTLYVAAEGRPYLIRATEKSTGTDKTTTLTDYDKPVPTKTPPASESVDMNKLQEELRQT